jgi:iron-sulfur cluster assembly accessory protein
MLTLTDSAVTHLRSLLDEKGAPEKALRIYIERGGCAGMSYEMTLDEPAPDDYAAERDGVRVIVDPNSLQYLTGSTIDYCDDLSGTGFRINNPKAARSCGCGTSFEPAQQEG